MKKLLILISLMLLLSSTVVSAGGIEMDYDIDFDNSIINIHCTTEAKYKQALSIVLYKGEEMGNDIKKIVRIVDINADEDGKADYEMKLSTNIKTDKYTLSVAGGGSVQGTVNKEGFQYYDKDDCGKIISAINGATQADIKSILETYSGIFTSLPSDDGAYLLFLKVREKDYNKKFTKVSDIKNALEVAQALYEINQINSETEMLKCIKDNAEVLDFDIEDTDFKKAEQTFATTFIKFKNAQSGIDSFTNFTKTWKQALAITTINSANSETMTNAIIKYGDIIGVSNSEYNADCAKYNAIEINKALRRDDVVVDKKYESCAEILEAYKNRISELSNSQVNTGNGGSSGGGSVVSSAIGVVQVTPNESTPNFVAFTDLSDAAWAMDSIKKLAADGIVSGYEDNSFKPNKSVVREEFVTLFIRAFNMLDSNAECESSDVKENDWCYPYIASATERDLVSGFEDGSFGKGSKISRQDAATMLYRVGKAYGLYFDNEEVDFKDGEEIAEYAKEAIGALNNSGIISGFEDGCFKPLDPLTRAQAVKMIEIMLNL